MADTYTGRHETVLRLLADGRLWILGRARRHARAPTSIEIKLKSQIARPRPYEHLVAGNLYAIVGATWTGNASVSGVEVSADNGLTAVRLSIFDPPQPYRRGHNGNWNGESLLNPAAIRFCPAPEMSTASYSRQTTMPAMAVT